MKISIYILCLSLGLVLAGCAAIPIPQHIQAQADQIPLDQLTRNFFLERDSCQSKRGEAQAACIEKTRRNAYAHKLRRAEANAEKTEQKLVK